MPGTLTHSPAQVLAALLVDLGLGAAPAGGGDQPAWPVFYDNEPRSPNDVITVVDAAPVVFGGDSYGARNEFHGIQVLVRGGTHAVAWPKANAVAAALDALRAGNVAVATLAGSSYCVGQVRRTSGPLRLGPEQGSTRRRFSINYLAWVKQRN